MAIGVRPKRGEHGGIRPGRTDQLRSKDWAEFASPGAPALDFVFTMCDQAANEACPAWPGQPMTAHWGIEDPAAASAADQPEAFRQALRYLRRRIERACARLARALTAWRRGRR